MHTIQPARLKTSASAHDVAPSPADAPAAISRRGPSTIRGRTLIFWAPDDGPGERRKLDAIDTDQITPAADCVSESLDTLDERWKAGTFRYLMPDFRARVHAGQTFVIVSHDIHVAERTFRIVNMLDGKIVNETVTERGRARDGQASAAG